MESEGGSLPRELGKLVKMCCVLAHSQGWVERGFNISKMFAEDRESLSVHTMKALKLVFGEVKRQGGADKVIITSQMLNCVKMSGREAKQAEAKAREKRERAAADEALEREAARKKKIAEDSKKDWESKKKELEDGLKSLQNYIDLRRKFVEDKLSQATKTTDPYKQKDLLTAIRLATEDKEKQVTKEREIQELLRVHMSKKKA